MTRTHRLGFTLTEIVVVVAIIGILVGILVPSLMGIRMRGKKTRELNLLKNVVQGWMMYSGDHQDQILPGHLSMEVQKYRGNAWAFPDETLIPPAPEYDPETLNIAGPWPWRLMSYFGNEWRSLLFYKEIDLVNELSDPFRENGQAVCSETAFGYNGYYLGGHWEIDHETGRPKAKFSGASLLNGQKLNVVTNVVSQIKSPSEQLVFTSVRPARIGTYKVHEDSANGFNLAMPSLFAENLNWELNSKTNSIEALRVSSIPIGRFNGKPTVGYADGHVGTIETHLLIDQRMWIPKATEVDGVPASEFTHTY